MRVSWWALMTPQPLQVMPEGLAMMSWARAPATSIVPCSWVEVGLLTSLRMILAVPAASQGLPWTVPARWVWVGVRALLRMAPCGVMSNCW